MSRQPSPRWPQGRQQSYQQQQSQQVWYPSTSRRRRRESKTILIVAVVLILVVVIAFVLGIVMYHMSAGVINTPPGGTRPVVTFTQVTKGGTPPSNLTASWAVAGASEPISSFSAFKGQILRDGIPLVTPAQTLKSNTKIMIGTVTLIVRDLVYEGKLTGGDTFLVYGMKGTHSWEFDLIWAWDGWEIHSTSWTTS